MRLLVAAILFAAVIGVLRAHHGIRAAGAEPLGSNPAHATQVARIRRFLGGELDTIDVALAQLDVATPPSSQVAQAAFRRARRQYKTIELLVEYYSPTSAVALNRPVADEEGDDARTGKAPPKGFQRIEPALFPIVDTAQWVDVHTQVGVMRTTVHQFHDQITLVSPTEPHLFEAARLELATVTTLGIAGFDATASGDAIPEVADALDGIREALRIGMTAPATEVSRTLTAASTYLRAHPDFETLDRFTFITQYANPAFRALADYGRTMPEHPLPLRRIWPLTATSVYDARDFNVMGYAPDYASRPTRELAALGQALFFDPLLSGNGERACASCHVPERAFTDGLAHARPFATGDPTPHAVLRNTPSLVNAAYQPALFADEHAGTLEDQIGIVIASPTEMHSSIDTVVRHLRESSEYQRWFTRAAGRPQDTTVSAWTVRIALAAYLRTLNGMNSRFDRAIRSDNRARASADTLTASERHGFNVFMGKAKCGTCHFAPLFNGSAPPSYAESEVEIIGTLAHPATHATRIDADLGRGGIDNLPAHNNAFKTPTLRNIAYTAPYMHNGAYATLEQVIDFYDRGGGAGAGAAVPYQTLDSRPLHLTPTERHDLIAFLGTLTDTAGTTGRPSRLPRIDPSTRDSTLRRTRLIGGRY